MVETQPIRVLLADDHTILRQGVRMLLERESDLKVVGEASDGQQAVALFQALRPDVVVMDISMPVMSGLIATRQIRQQAPGARVLILTMHDSDAYVFDMLDAGACGYVLKETAAEQLVDAVHSVVQGDSVIYPSVALRLRPGARDVPLRGRLTEREVEVVQLVAEGLTNQQIAARLNVSPKTVQAHRNHIMEKLDLHDRVDLVKYALRQGLCSF